MKKIALFHPVDDFYGASKIFCYTVAQLSKEYVCDIYIPFDNGSLRQIMSGIEHNPNNLKFISLDYLPVTHKSAFTPSGLLNWIRYNIKFYNHFKTDGLYLEYSFFYINTFALFSLSLISRLLNIPNVVHCHEYLADSIIGKVIKTTVNKYATKLIAVSDHVYSYINEKNGKSTVIHNGIPDVYQKPEMPVLKESKRLNISFVGRVMPEKGHWFLIETLKLMDKELLSHIQINIYGDSPPLRPELYDEFKSIVDHSELSDTVILHGHCKNVMEIIANCDLSLVPSLMKDPFPTTVLESMSLGIPVLTTNHGGAKEVVINEYNGFLIEPNNTVVFSETLKEIIKGKYDLKEIGVNGRRQYLKTSSISVYQGKVSALCSSLI
ncbi:glycosyltransferase family 4 protein [Vibrio sp. Vb339]|uniref:glycosyltransferase family 4 protein n=1 Tax=Vibrio sp. Vb339 TaxID=1192013 RepID=UPI001555C83E|nr:glycosyltransferase family 4 protein [Vibrio sp. Vb339]